ncbi:MAG: hypothetical protein ACKO2K_21220 [Alphaproteobacteria bacterium]
MTLSIPSLPSTATIATHAVVVLLALFTCRRRVRRLQSLGDRRPWSHLLRIAFAFAVAVAVRAAQSTTLKPLLQAAFAALLPLGRLPWLAVAGSDGEAISTLSWQIGMLVLLVLAWALPFYALGLSAGFAFVRRPSVRLRRATGRLLVASGALLLAAYAGTSWLRPAGLDLGALRDRVAATGLEPSAWPLALVVLGVGMRWLFPLAEARTATAPDDAAGAGRSELQASETSARRWGW